MAEISYIGKESIHWTSPEDIYRQSLAYNISFYNFSALRWCESRTRVVETILGNLNLDGFPGLAICNMVLMTQGGSLHSSQSTTWSKVTNRYTDDHSGPTQPFCFSLSTVLNKLHAIFNTLSNRLCVRGFCSTVGSCKCSEYFQGGQTIRRMFGKSGVLHAFSTYEIFNLWRVFNQEVTPF